MIRKLIKDTNLVKTMHENEALTWQGFVEVVQNFLEKHKSEIYKYLVSNMVSTFCDIGANIYSTKTQ